MHVHAGIKQTLINVFSLGFTHISEGQFLHAVILCHVYSVVRLKDSYYIIMVTNVDTGTHRNMSVYNETYG